ncbi:MAG: TonB-dependent receptor [Candidatus Sabulitectum sp.]|nr:TonB-dependent receptor [Candidatus Sabulitectum sp.]
MNFSNTVLIVPLLLSTLLLAEDGDVITTGTIVVSATKTLIETQEVVEELDVITVEDIENSGASTTEELMQTIPGITIYKHPQTQIRINGMEGAYTLILIDGVPVHANVGGGVPIENIPLGDIERIEIIKGASSAIYGSSAVGGVINFITKKLSRSTEITGGYRYQTNVVSNQFNTPGYEDETFEVATGQRAHWPGAHSGDAGLRTTLGIFDIKASCGFYFDVGVVDTIIKRPVSLFGNRPYWTMNEMKRSFGNLYSGVDVSDDLTLSVDGRFSIDEDKRSLSKDVVRSFINYSYNGILRGSYFLEENVSFNGYLSAQRFDHNYRNYNFNLEAKTKDSYSVYDTFDFELRSIITLDDANELVAGVNFIRESVHNEDIENDKQNGYEVAGFLQESFNYEDEDRFFLTSGLRGTYNSRFSGAINPKIGARFNFFDALYLRVSFGTGFNAPSFKQNYYDNFIHPKPHDFLLSGNPDLTPEKSWSISGSVGGFSNMFSYKAYGHFTVIDDKISTMIVSEEGGSLENGQVYSYQRGYVNVAESRSYGADLSLGITGIDIFNISGSFSYLHMEDRDSSVGTYQESELYSPFTIKVSATFDTTRLGRYIPTVNAMFNYESKQIWNRAAEEGMEYLESYATLNLSLKERLNENITFTLGVNNVLDNGSDDLGFGYGRIGYADVRFSH